MSCSLGERKQRQAPAVAAGGFAAALSRRRRLTAWLAIVAASAILRSDAGLAERAFEVVYPQNALDGPLTGRVFVFLSKHLDGEPRLGPDWFHPEPFFGVDVSALAPGGVVLVDDRADGFPSRLGVIPPGTYLAQAVLDHDFEHQDHNRGVGNWYSEAQRVLLGDHRISLVLDRRVVEEPFAESAWCREVTIRSDLLSAFHGREAVHRAAVLLPQEFFDSPATRFPVVYVIGGFGSTHRAALRVPGPTRPGPEECSFIEVYLNGDCKWGHHVFADSATNGPRGLALVRELIPYIDATFPTIAEARARFVTGHSSGGWSSLWLQVEYPDTFGGVWSTSPDPVDFRDFQQVDLYAQPPKSLYFDDQNRPRPIARRGRDPVLWFKDFARMDDVLKRGGQLRSFEAVFSPPGDNGLPRPLWDRETGRVDTEVAEAWKAYDIRLKLERRWPELRDKLRGKLRIHTGELDTFYLEGAVKLLQGALAQFGSDAVVEIHPGKNHSNLRTAQFERRIRREMSASFRVHNLEEARSSGHK